VPADRDLADLAGSDVDALLVDDPTAQPRQTNASRAPESRRQ
jgi:hypothetical protein